MTLTTKAHAEEAIAEYNEVYAAGGEIDYPHWADAVLKAIEQAEQLARQVGELGEIK